MPQPVERRSGLATHYAAGLMDRRGDPVPQARIGWGHIPDQEEQCYIATLYRRDVGRLAYVMINGQRVGPCRIADCGEQTAQYIRSHEAYWAVDLSWELAERFGTTWRGAEATVEIVE